MLSNTKLFVYDQLSKGADLESKQRQFLLSLGVTPFYDKIKNISYYFRQNLYENDATILQKQPMNEEEMYLRYGYIASVFCLESLNLFVKEAELIYRLVEINVFENLLFRHRYDIYDRTEQVNYLTMLTNSFYFDYSAFLLLFNDIYFHFEIAQSSLLKGNDQGTKLFNLLFKSEREILPDFYCSDNRFFYNEQYFNLKEVEDIYSGKRNIDYADISVNYLTKFWAKYKALNKLITLKIDDSVDYNFAKFSSQVLNHN